MPGIDLEPYVGYAVRVRHDTGRTLLAEQRGMRFLPQADGQWLLVIDLEFKAAKEPVTIGKTPFGIIGVRMAKTIGVHDGGGTIARYIWTLLG